MTFRSDGQSLGIIFKGYRYIKQMKIQLYIDTANTFINVKDGLFLVKNKKLKRQISPSRIDSIAITSNVQLNTSVIKLASKNDIPIFIQDALGRTIAELRSSCFLKHSQLRLKQLQFMHQKEGKEWAKRQILLKLNEQQISLKRWKKQFPKHQEILSEIVLKIQSYIPKIKEIDSTNPQINDTLMGYEGGVAKHYFKAINTILPPQYQFEKRSRRPGKDYYNVALNYLYGMTYNEITRAIQSAGLDTFCGTLHKTQYGETLVYDFIEPFRPIVDRLLIDLCLEEVWKDKHFIAIEGGFKLNREGKKVLLPKYADYMNQRINWQGKVTSIRNQMFLHSRRLKHLINTTEYVFNFL